MSLCFVFSKTEYLLHITQLGQPIQIRKFYIKRNTRENFEFRLFHLNSYFSKVEAQCVVYSCTTRQLRVAILTGKLANRITGQLNHCADVN